MRELPQPTAGETARSLQEVARLFADETARMTPTRDHLARFVEDAKAMAPCLEELIGFLADEGDTPVRNHDQWLYQIDTAVMLLDQAADARSRGHDHVVHCLMFAVEALLDDVTSYAQLELGVPLTLPRTRKDDYVGGSPKRETIH